MKKTIPILLILALIVSLALVSCTPNDVPNDGADTSGNENGDGNDSGEGGDEGASVSTIVAISAIGGVAVVGGGAALWFFVLKKRR